MGGKQTVFRAIGMGKKEREFNNATLLRLEGRRSN